MTANRSSEHDWLKAMNLTLTTQLVDTNQLLRAIVKDLEIHLVDLSVRMTGTNDPVVTEGGADE
jgi:hypothetical protein